MKFSRIFKLYLCPHLMSTLLIVLFKFFLFLFCCAHWSCRLGWHQDSQLPKTAEQGEQHYTNTNLLLKGKIKLLKNIGTGGNGKESNCWRVWCNTVWIGSRNVAWYSLIRFSQTCLGIFFLSSSYLLLKLLVDDG